MKKTPNGALNNECRYSYNTWLGMRDLFQTFSDELITDEDQVCDIQEIRQLLKESQGNEVKPEY